MASAVAEGKSRVLVIGGTGYIGSFIVAASAREGHPTAVLVRDATLANAAKADVLQSFRDAGVTLVKEGKRQQPHMCVIREIEQEPARAVMAERRAAPSDS